MHATRDGGAVKGPTADTRVHFHAEPGSGQCGCEVIANCITACAANGCRLWTGDVLQVGVCTLDAEHRCWRGCWHWSGRPAAASSSARGLRPAPRARLGPPYDAGEPLRPRKHRPCSDL
jgi:hypothetical protein